MQFSGSTTAHLPFIAALSALSSDVDPDWTIISAGLLSLRVTDAWANPGEITDDELAVRIAGIAPVVDAIRDDDELRDALRALVASLGPRNEHTAVQSALLAYGRVLERRARLELALDVYSSVVDLHAPDGFLGPNAIEALVRIAECHRHRAEWTRAEEMFAYAADRAGAAGDMEAALRARCYGAAVTAERGDADAAAAQLAAVQTEAERARRKDLSALARHALAHVEFLRGDVERAARLAFDALDDLRDPRERDRALADVAAAFAELGVRSAARDAQLIISATTDDAYVRWTSLINLMELAAGDRVQPAFEQYRHTLAAQRLPPRLAGYFHFYAAAGLHAFGDPHTARDEYRRALGIATRARLAQLAHEAEAALRKLDAALPPPDAPPARAPTPATASIAGALARMRESVLPDSPC